MKKGTREKVRRFDKALEKGRWKNQKDLLLPIRAGLGGEKWG